MSDEYNDWELSQNVKTVLANTGEVAHWNTAPTTPTLSAAMELPEVRALVDALKHIQRETARCRGDQAYRDACKMALATSTAALAQFKT